MMETDYVLYPELKALEKVAKEKGVKVIFYPMTSTPGWGPEEDDFYSSGYVSLEKEGEEIFSVSFGLCGEDVGSGKKAIEMAIAFLKKEVKE